MSVPGRVGLILIVALALIDGIIVLSGARKAASAIESGASFAQTIAPIEPVKHDQLLNDAVRGMKFLTTRPAVGKTTSA